jgi:hypothetical protein
MDAIQITYQGKETTCRNCPEGQTYESARKQWEAAKSGSGQSCEVFADPMAQVFGH